MSMLNNPKNMLPLLVILGAGMFVYTRRATAAQALYRPSAPGATVSQQSADAARNMGVINLLGGLGNWLQPSTITPAARAAVRAGDPYYATIGLGGIAPSWSDQWYVDAGAWRDAGYAANSGSTGDPYNPEGYYE